MVLLVQFTDNGSRTTISIGMMNINLENVINKTDRQINSKRQKKDRKDDNMKEKHNIKDRKKSPHLKLKHILHRITGEI